MKRLRILALSLALLLICLSPAGTPRAWAAERYTACPYWIGVDIVNQRLTVYRTADNVAAHRWLCTTGRAGFETPTGVFYMPEKKGDERKSWCKLDGYKVRYASRVADGFYIHSVQYTDEKDDAVKLASLVRLGHTGTLGSVIVEYAHAKWISQNCPKGTMVVVHAGVNDPLITGLLMGDAGTDTTESLPEPPTVESITMNPSSEFSIAIGETRQLSCTFKPSGAEGSLEWESSDAKHATVDGSGLVRGVSEGKSTIKARTVNGKEAKVKVSVYDPTKPTGVSLSASGVSKRDGDRAILNLNDGVQMTATLSPSTAVSGLEWKSTSTKRGTVNGSGWVTAIGEGDFEIEVKTTKEGKKAKYKFKVVDNTKPTGVSLSASGVSKRDGDRAILNLNDGVQMTATLSPSTAVSGLEWKSTNTKRGTVNGSGWVTAVSEGDFEIEVKTTKEGKKAKYKFKVVDNTKPTGVSLYTVGVTKWDGDRAIIKKGEGIQLYVSLSPSTAVTDLEWKSTNTKHGQVNSNGWVTYAGDGDFEVEVKTKKEGKKAKYKFKAVDQPNKVKMTKAPDIKVGQTVQFKAEIEPKGTSSGLTWSSSDNSIATVDSNGNVYGKKKGTVKITVRTDNGKETTEKIKVK